ncbi:hypothetical protein O0L34_g5540 [Tuta absoluta]|nr:hypothetical protein O0L34_g5540 [Tuta absoluta]
MTRVKSCIFGLTLLYLVSFYLGETMTLYYPYPNPADHSAILFEGPTVLDEASQENEIENTKDLVEAEDDAIVYELIDVRLKNKIGEEAWIAADCPEGYIKVEDTCFPTD